MLPFFDHLDDVEISNEVIPNKEYSVLELFAGGGADLL